MPISLPPPAHDAPLPRAVPGAPLLPPAHDAPLPRAVAGVAGTRVLAGVPYAALPGIRPLELDIVLPALAGGAVPAVVFLHGGGWRAGSRHSAGPVYADARRSPFELVAQAGIAVVSIDYRLSGEATWPAQLHDAKAAVRWVRSRAGELGIDPERIAAWGESAGGQLAEMLGLTGGAADLEGDVGVAGPSSQVAAVVAWFAPSDIAAVATDTGADPADPSTREALLLGAPAATVPQRAADASPITHVHAGAPPFLLLHGTGDSLVPCVQSERLRDALVAAGCDVQLHTYDGAEHMWLGDADVAADAVRRTIDVLTQTLKAE